MIEQLEGLEGKLVGVRNGDLLLLRKTEGPRIPEDSPDLVQGFVKEIAPRKITLCQGHPENTKEYGMAYPEWSSGNKRYDLKEFDSYQVIPVQAISE